MVIAKIIEVNKANPKMFLAKYAKNPKMFFSKNAKNPKMLSTSLP